MSEPISDLVRSLIGLESVLREYRQSIDAFNRLYSAGLSNKSKEDEGRIVSLCLDLSEMLKESGESRTHLEYELDWKLFAFKLGELRTLTS